MSAERPLLLYLDKELGEYHFGDEHPFGPLRMEAFCRLARELKLDEKTMRGRIASAPRELLALFHDPDYIDRVAEKSRSGVGYLDACDTPAAEGIFEAAARVVGTTVSAAREIMEGEAHHAFVPIAGLHHARRDMAAGFCVFSDIGVVIEVLKRDYGLTRIAYVDIDAHHGDGVMYPFYEDPTVLVVDLHQEGIYPMTGDADETGRGPGEGSKRNFPLPDGATDQDFMVAWEQGEAFLAKHEPEFIILQCGADSLKGDPITSLSLTPACYAHAARRMVRLAGRCCDGRLLAMGGGGYNLENIAAGWTAVVEAMLQP